SDRDWSSDVCSSDLKLRPRAEIKFRRPVRQRFRTHFAEQIAGSKWPIRDHGDAALLSQRQNAFLGFSFHQRIIDLEKIELLTPRSEEHTSELQSRSD